MTPSRSTVVVSHDGPVATVELRRPHRLNALDEPMRAALLAALTGLAVDDGVRVVVLTGAGRAFCVGQDLAATGELTDAHDTVARTYNPVVRVIVGMDKPVVAAVNGPAVGAGMGFALACDLVLMSASASLSCAFGKVALVPDSGTAWVLVRRLGHARAFDLATTGRRVGSEEAAATGLANEVLADDELLPAAAKRAADLAAGPAVTLALTKRLLVAGAEQSLEHVLQMEALGQGRAAATDEHVALRAAFLDRS